MPMETYGPGNSSDRRPSREPTWTTGQGIGFLVSFSGWLIAGLGLLGLAVGVAVELEGEVMAVLGPLTAFGVISAIPGTVVFNKCKRPLDDGHDPKG